MRKIESKNPVFSRAGGFEEQREASYEYASASYGRIGLKTLYFILMMFVGGGIDYLILSTNPGALIPVLIIAAIASFIFAIIAMRSPSKAFLFGSLYSISVGMGVILISALFEAMVGGIIITAMGGVLAVVIACSILYATGIVKVNSGFLRFTITISVAFMFAVLFIWIYSMFKPSAIVGNWGLFLVISLISVFIASLYLLLDMKQINELVSSQGPKELEWMLAFGLAYDIIWLYIEMLRILFYIAMIFGDN